MVRGDDNKLVIGSLTSFQNTNINIQEGTSIYIGENCMFAASVQIRTTDEHSILDMSGKRINEAKNIIIGDKCWLGLESIILKGASIPCSTIVGLRSEVTKAFKAENTLLAGIPAKVIKEGVCWDRRLL